MPARSSATAVFTNEDHWFTLVTAIITVVALALLSNLPWFWLLVVGALVSGVVEFAIREIPSDRTDYDSEQYRFWDAGFGGRSNVDTDNRTSAYHSEDQPASRTNRRSPSGSLETLRNRYARGELTEDQFKQKVDHLLETDTPENAVDWREKEHEALRE